jgi:UDPglucose--hexose-1-phosphate uridylyltransferase
LLALQDSSHRRFNPLTRDWVLVSPHRTDRPWQGQTERRAEATAPAYDPDCYLCPGNPRANGECNPPYAGTLAFDNDFAALRRDAPTDEVNEDGLLVARGEPGVCRVICFSPRHDLTLSRMNVPDIVSVVEVWGEEYRRLGSLGSINSVQIFENRGSIMGASNPHPHCQIWASHGLPNELAKEAVAQSDYLALHQSCLLCDYLALEEKAGERIVCQNEHFVVLVPFWAVWPFETMLLPRRHIGALDESSTDEAVALANILGRLTIRYDNLFEAPFPYSMGFHQRPTDGYPHPDWHFHGHFYPPLLRSATVRKFMVGFEMLGSPQRDITAESAAQRLRNLPAVHYLDRGVGQDQGVSSWA